MRRILIIAGRYLPGYRDGGPVRSIINLTEWFGDEYDILIYCHDRDHGDTGPYPGITYGQNMRVGKAQVRYTLKHTADEMASLAADADVVYVAGLYDAYARLAMMLKKTGKITAPVFVAPMGSFSPEAFKIKGTKKHLFIMYMKLTGMFSDITWSVTSAREEEELKAAVGNNIKCIIASDLPRMKAAEHTRIKEKGSLKLVFISRIARKKNLSFIPSILKTLDEDANVKLDIYGPCEDREYFDTCLAALDELKKTHPNCKWEYMGEADSERVPEIFAGYDAFLFPTLGENYGHVIAESLSAGCIPVISDTTPWLNLSEKGCGYVCSLNDKKGFGKALAELLAMSEEELAVKRDKCLRYITEVNSRSVENSGYRKIFGQ